MWVAKKALCIIVGIIGIILLAVLGGYVISAMGRGLATGVVVIDAGHGGIDRGVSYEGLYEADVNLEIARMLSAELDGRGYKTVMTRDGDKALADGKSADMKARAEVINSTKPDLVLSIHVNNWRGQSRRGAQVFYDDTGKWMEVGERMQGVLNTYVNAKYSKRNDLRSLGGDYYITKCSPYPTVIIETGFMSNRHDHKLLQSAYYRTDVVLSIAKCVDSMMSEYSYI